jgi:MFS family permease
MASVLMTPVSQFSSPSSGLDLRVILEAPLRLFAPWLAIVLVVTWAGYPGVVCVTPMAWLLALRVGIAVVGRSASAQPAQRLREAALAGGLFGLLQGALFGVLVLRLGEILPGERAGAAVLIGAVLIFGILVGAGLSLFTASQVERRQRAAS